jgi:GNAT superfamily N-acetyltransferase
MLETLGEILERTKDMKIKIINITEENLKDAPDSCKHCIYWEFPDEYVNSVNDKKEKMIQKKLKWLRDTNRLFGNCGKMLYVDGKAVGYSQYAPPKFLPCSADYQAGPPSKNAVLISCLFVSKRQVRRSGLGSKLLQSIIDDLKERRIKAVETFAGKDNVNNPSGPVEFYLRNRFRIYKDDKEFPLMRLEL